MAYIVLVVGAVMALLGATAVVTGYPIIQVERGWATVIAGTTLLTGGFVTMALGVLIHTIMNAKTAVTEFSQAAPRPAETATAVGHDEPIFNHVSGPAPTVAMAGAAAASVATLAMTDTAPHHEAAEDPHPRDETHIAPAADFHPVDEPAPAPVAAHDQHPPAAPMDDWLDKAFADLALETPPRSEPEPVPSTQAEPEPLHPEHAQHDRDHTVDPHQDTTHLLRAEDVTHRPVDLDLVHADGPHAADVVPAIDHTHHEPANAAHDTHAEAQSETAYALINEPAVIGRYEADGTSYTMFADGSIEAQSEAGIYRFASMADLKAFIES